MNKETIQKMLPLGSVVTLHGGSKKIMICGRLQEDSKTGKMYDYAACYYPEGILSADELFLFQQEDVDMIYYVGMQESEEFAFRHFAEEELTKRGLL